jgi:hypothetical protein
MVIEYLAVAAALLGGGIAIGVLILTRSDPGPEPEDHDHQARGDE